MHERILGERRVLDHGLVRLLDPFMGSDLHVVRAARVSYDAAWRAGDDEDKDTRLMRRLWRGKPEPKKDDLSLSIKEIFPPLPSLPKHSTPFEACCMTFEVMAPIFVFRQWHRHRTQSYNELSARYRKLPRTYYLPEAEIVGIQDPKNKQGRVLSDSQILAARVAEIEMLRNHNEAGFELYDKLVDSGWPLELARLALGFGTYSHMFATMNMLNFFKFANLRADAHAQYEIRVYAEAMLDMVADICPVSVALFREANPQANG